VFRRRRFSLTPQLPARRHVGDGGDDQAAAEAFLVSREQFVQFSSDD